VTAIRKDNIARDIGKIPMHSKKSQPKGKRPIHTTSDRTSKIKHKNKNRKDCETDCERENGIDIDPRLLTSK